MLAALWLPGFNQGAFRVDTGLYAAVALRAWREGPLMPLFAGDAPYFNKPPLPFWIHGAFLHVLGPDLWVARLPSLLAAIAAVMITVSAVRTLAGPRRALAAGCILALTLEFFRYTKAISLDLWLTLFIMAAIWCVARAISNPASTRRRWIVASGVPLGLALLCKPFVALLTIPIVAAWFIIERRSIRQSLPALAAAALISIVIAALWYVPMHLRFGDTFLAQHVGKQTIERATGESFGGEPWWWYAALLAKSYWPWLIAAALGAYAFLTARLAPRHRTLARGAMLWSAAWLIALSAFAGKSGRYALPLYPMLACIAALWLAHAPPRPIAVARRAFVRWGAPVMLTGAIVMLSLGVRIHAPPPKHWEALYRFVRDHPDERIIAGSDMLWTSANIYLHTGRWPETAPSQDAAASTKTPHSIRIYRDHTAQAPPPGSIELWRSGPMFAIDAAAAGTN